MVLENKIIVGISGSAGVGKSTFTQMLINVLKEYEIKSRVVPFGEPLKKFAKDLGWNGIKDEKGRRLLQLLGTECGRKCIDDDIWVNKWYKRILGVFEPVIIADDMRFINELESIKKFTNHITVRLKLPNENSFFNQLKKLRCHASEKGFKDSQVNYAFLSIKGDLNKLRTDAKVIANEIVRISHILYIR